MPTPEAIETELDVLAARAGLTIPPDRRKAILAGYAEVRGMADLLRSVDIGPADEPSNVYTFDPILRSA
jgi:hypothetical protein